MKHEWLITGSSEQIKNCPLGARAVNGALESFAGAEDYLEDLGKWLRVWNPGVASFLLDECEGWAEFEDKLSFKVGTLLAYEVFKEQMGFFPPILGEDFVNYCAGEVIQRRLDLEDKLGEKVIDRVRFENNVRKSLFIGLEPEAYRALSEALLDDPTHQSLFDHPILDGFAFAYFFLKTGFDNPSTWDINNLGANPQQLSV